MESLNILCGSNIRCMVRNLDCLRLRASFDHLRSNVWKVGFCETSTWASWFLRVWLVWTVQVYHMGKVCSQVWKVWLGFQGLARKVQGFMIYGQVRSQNGNCHVFVASEGLEALDISYEMCAGCWLSGGSSFWHGLCFESIKGQKSLVNVGFVKWLCGLAQIWGLGSFGQFIWVICEGFMRLFGWFDEVGLIWLEKCMTLNFWANDGPFWELSSFGRKMWFGHIG